MDFNQEKMSFLGAFKLMGEDLSCFFKKSGLTKNQLSPYEEDLDSIPDGSPSARLQTLMDSPLYHKAALLLLEPDLKIIFHRGGSFSKDEIYYALSSHRINEILVEFTASDGNLEIVVFSDWNEFLRWWMTLYTTEGNNNYKEIFPGSQEIEILVCAIHCIDIYKRAYLESMLNYETKVNTEITTQKFAKLLKESIIKGDNRWLLPSLFNLTPGLKNKAISLQPHHMKKIEELGFIRENEENMIAIEKLGKVLGTEFASTWMGSVGFAVSAIINGQAVVLDQKYLAPTAFTNHLFSMETEKEGLFFQHGAFSTENLITLLEKWMVNLKKIAYAEITDQIEPTEKIKYCKKCGNPLKPNQKFCKQCGTPVR